jgi:hypothetical protein
VQLFDIQADPYELHDIGSQEGYATLVADLSRRLLRWMVEVDDPLLQGPLRTPYYERAIADLRRAEPAVDGHSANRAPWRY